MGSTMLPAMSRATERTASSIASETASERVVDTTMTSRGNHTFLSRPPLPTSVAMAVVTLLAKKVHGSRPHRR